MCTVILLLCLVYYMFVWFLLFFFFKQKTAYEMRISDWSSDVCSSDLSRDAYRPSFRISFACGRFQPACLGKRRAYMDGHQNARSGYAAPSVDQLAVAGCERLAIRLSTTEGSASVEVSPRFEKSFSPILRKMRRMILPERVLGKDGVNWITSGVAIGPI